MKRLEPGHLRPKLQVSELTCPGRESNTSLRSGRRALEQLLNSYLEHLHTCMSARPVDNARDMVPPGACGT
jgi:hypothetical protein